MAKIQANTDLIYDSFVEKVAQGRNMDLEKAKSIAQGRVWSGLKAQEIGLADFYGGLQDAIKHAATLANLGDNWETKPYPRKKEFSLDLIEFFQDSQETKEITAGILNKYFKFFKTTLKNFNSFNDPGNLYARMPNVFIIK